MRKLFGRALFAFVALGGQLAAGAKACDIEIPRQRMQASASATAAGSSSADLIDGSTSTSWNSGGFPVQWVQVDLGQKQPLCRLLLTVRQSPEGSAKHIVLVGDTPDALVEVATVERNFVDGESVDVPIQANARYVRVRTERGPSWVAWRELKAYSGQSAAMPANAAGLRYFGYWMSGGSVNAPDPTPMAANEVLYNATSAVNGYTNVTTARIWFLADRVAELDALGDTSSKIVVDLYDIFFNPASPYAEEWQARNMDGRIRAHAARIAAFILRDEPDLDAALTDAQMRDRIVFLKARLAALGVSIPIFVDYSYLAFQSGRWPGFADADWVSFNCYPQDRHPGATVWNRYDRCGSDRTLTGYVDQLKAKMGVGQKMVLFPQSFYRVPVGSAPSASTPVPAGDKQHMVEIVDHLMLIAENDPSVVAIMNFIYQSYENPSGSSPEAWIGSEWLGDADPSRDVRGRLMEAGMCVEVQLQGCLPRRLRPISVIASQAQASAGNALDGTVASAWNSGKFPSAGQPQWIRLEFPREIGISEIRLTPLQDPSCAVTTHEIWGGRDAGNMTRLAVRTDNTCDNTAFIVDRLWRNNDLKVIEVRTLASSSWVAWRDIQIYR